MLQSTISLAYTTLDAVIRLNKITRPGDDVLLQAQAEDAAKALAHGPGHFCSEDVHLLAAYSRIAASWFEHVTDTCLKTRHEALMEFIRAAKLLEHKEQLIETAQLYGHKRCYLALINTSIC